MERKKIIVIGAGPAGITAAQQLAAQGHDVSLFEAGAQVGGLARSFQLWNQTVDCGPHRFFSNDTIVNNYFHKMIGSEYTLVNRLTRIYYNNKFFYYPLQAFNALSNLPIITVFQILWSYAMQRVNPIKDPQTFEEWVTNRFGKKLFSIFFKNYSEKLWGIPCSKIDAEWAAQRIKKLSLWEAVISAIFGGGGKKHKTLVDQFAYPKNGTGALYEKIKKQFLQDKGQLFLNTKITRVLQNTDESVSGIELADGTQHSADIIISTMPLTNMVKSLPLVPPSIVAACDKLYFRNTILVYVEIKAQNLFPDNWIYIHSPEVLHGRITNFSNWCSSLQNGATSTILCLEYWCFDQDEIWTKDEKYMGELAVKELKILKLIQPTDEVLNTYLLHIPKCYPVYETGYNTHLQPVVNYLKTIPNLFPIGRYGAFKYNNQDHSILMGLLIAEEIKTGVSQNLWSINTDSEYQEEAEIVYQTNDSK